MRKYVKNLVASLLLVIFIVSSYLPINAVGQPTTYSSYSNSGERDVVATTLDGTSADDYYTGIYEYDELSELSGSELLTSLRTLMSSTHTYTSTYDNCRDYAVRTDCENEDGRVVTIYTSYSATFAQYQGGSGWNREHVWPKSLGGGNTSGGGADLHHIRPSENRPNSTRGNKRYGYADGGKEVFGNLSSMTAGHYASYYEPIDNVKGDVARICLYVYVRWGSDWGADSVTEVFQSIDVLLEWCEMDPVDTWELGRNEVVEGIQGNRNVFIDYPELAWLLFDKEVPTDMVTPSGEAMSGSGSVTPTHKCESKCEECGRCLDTGCSESACALKCLGHVPVCPHTNKAAEGYVKPGCFTDGYTGDFYCLDCGELAAKGDILPAKNKHNFSSWELTDEGETYVRHCLSCSHEQEMLTVDVIDSIESDPEKVLLLIYFGSIDSALLDVIYQETE